MHHFHFVGILNVTPDSYFDGGTWKGVDGALKRAEQMIDEGADWIEVGGESTGPKSVDVSEEEELHRVIPVIEAIAKRFPHVKISIDTYKSAVARSAVEAGATMVNDVTAGREDPRMFAILASLFTENRISEIRNPALPAGRPKPETRNPKPSPSPSPSPFLVLMYSKDPTPRTTIAPQKYSDVITTIKEFLRSRRDAAIRAGIAPDRIILDPGLGHFVSSDPQYSYQILARLREFHDLECPIFISPSRKSFLAGSENLSPKDRLSGTIAASAIAALNGATYIRTHDIADVRRGCKAAGEILHHIGDTP